MFSDISKKVIRNIVGIDMGGTSTDISRVEDGKYQLKYSYEVEDVEICTPHL